MRWESVIKVGSDVVEKYGFGWLLKQVAKNPGIYVIPAPFAVIEKVLRSYEIAQNGSPKAGVDMASEAISELSRVFESAPERPEVVVSISKIYEMAAVIGERVDRLLAETLRVVEEYYADLIKANANGVLVVRIVDIGVVAVKKEGGVAPVYDTSYQNIREWASRLNAHTAIVPVICPFDADGRPLVPDDGWADSIAVIIASSLGLNDVTVLTAEPQITAAEARIINGASVIRKLSYAEAMEIAAFYPSLIGKDALVLAEEHGISIRFRAAGGEGSVISGERSVSTQVIKSVAAKRSLGIITVKGRDMVGLLPRLMSELIGAGVRLSTLTLSTSGTEVSLVLPRDNINTCRKLVEFKFMGKGVDDYKVVKDVCAISVIGEGMRGTPGIASRLFTSVAKKGINIIMIMQGSSELNIGFIVDDRSCEDAIRAVYEEFLSTAG